MGNEKESVHRIHQLKLESLKKGLRIGDLGAQLSSYYVMSISFWKRLKFLFTGSVVK